MSLKPQYGNFFRFEENDVIVNRIKTYPKVEFFIHENVTKYNNENNDKSLPLNTPNGAINLYEYNVNRGDGGADTDLIYPFVTKIGAGTSLGTVTDGSYVFDFDVGDEITGSYPMTASISLDQLGKKTNWSTLTESADGKKKNYIPALKTSLDFYSKLSPHYVYSSSAHGDLDEKDVNLISIPSIFYGSSIKKGTVTLQYFVTGTLVGYAQDSNKNGELIYTNSNSEGDLADKSVVGVVLYNEGFIMLTSSVSIADHTEVYSPQNVDGTEPDAVKSSWFNFGVTGSTAKAPNSSFHIQLSGTNYIDTLTMFAHAKENKLNYSNNPTFLTSGIYQYSSEPTAFTENPDNKIKNIVSSSHAKHSASFEPVTYISKVGIYDEDRNLIAIASVARPVRKREKDSYTFKLKLDI